MHHALVHYDELKDAGAQTKEVVVMTPAEVRELLRQAEEFHQRTFIPEGWMEGFEPPLASAPGAYGRLVERYRRFHAGLGRMVRRLLGWLGEEPAIDI